jgi:hypothetical protein
VEVVAMASTVAALLADFGVSGSESDFVSALRAALAREPRPGTSTLTDAEAAVLADHSGIDPATAARLGSPGQVAVDRARVEFDLLRRSFTAHDIAAKWGVDDSRIRHRVRNRVLFGVRIGRALRLPTWQFDDELRPLPGLSAVLAALPEGMHPREVEGFMTTPQADLRVRGRDVSPRDWLLTGGDAAQVAAHAADLDRW